VAEIVRSNAGIGNVDLSEQFCYWNCKHRDNHQGDGTYPWVAFRGLKSDGVCEEATWPYNPRKNTRNPGYGPPPTGAKDEARRYKIAKAIRIPNPRDVAGLKREIRKGFPVAVAIPAYDSWVRNNNIQRTGNIGLPLPGEVARHGHALVLIGFADDPDFAGGGYFVARNSWGTAWGSGSSFGPGYGTLPFRFVEYYNQDARTVRV
jgi:hypothetical protein